MTDAFRPPEAPGDHSQGGSPPPRTPLVIPLMPGVSRAAGERRAMLREAVIQVVRHLVVKAIPPSHRVPLFG